MNLRSIAPISLITIPAAMIVAVACSSNGTTTGGSDAAASDSGTDTSIETTDGGSDATSDAPATTDAGSEGGAPLSPGLHIVAASGAPLGAAAGDAIPLTIVVVGEDGGIQPLPAGTSVTWIAPSTVEAQNPWDAGSNSVLPTFGAEPTGIFIDNPYRTDRTDYAGTLFVIDPGTNGGGTLTVTALVGDASMVTTTLPVVPTPSGDVDAGASLFLVIHNCAGCHGATGDGSPPAGDAGPDGAVEYDLQGTLYPYPAPGLNDTSPGGQPNLAADPGWNAALLGMAAQGDIDNNGVALRLPMPDWLGKKGLDGGPLGAGDFADIYAFLKTQTQ